MLPTRRSAEPWPAPRAFLRYPRPRSSDAPLVGSKARDPSRGPRLFPVLPAPNDLTSRTRRKRGRTPMSFGKISVVTPTDTTLHRLRLIRTVAIVDFVLLVPLVAAALSHAEGVVDVLGPIHGVGFLLLVLPLRAWSPGGPLGLVVSCSCRSYPWPARIPSRRTPDPAEPREWVRCLLGLRGRRGGGSGPRAREEPARGATPFDARGVHRESRSSPSPRREGITGLQNRRGAFAQSRPRRAGGRRASGQSSDWPRRLWK